MTVWPYNKGCVQMSTAEGKSAKLLVAMRAGNRNLAAGTKSYRECGDCAANEKTVEESSQKQASIQRRVTHETWYFNFSQSRGGVIIPYM